MISLRSSAICVLAASLGVNLVACRDGTTASTKATRAPLPLAARAQPAELGPHQSPVTVKLRGPDQVSPGQDIELWAEVERRSGAAAQVSLVLQLPPGARLVSGQDSELLPSGNGTLRRRFVVHLEQVPSTDIEAVATAQSTSFGARARSAYRFGRPEPRFAEPERRQRPLKLSGKDLGRPILLRPTR